MPTFQVFAPCHKDSVLNSAFASNYGDLISNNRIDAWIYGHSHTNIDAEIGGTKVLSNQMGYVFQNEHLMNGFDSGKYENKEDFFRDWHSFNPMETRWFHYSSYVSDNNEYYNDEWRRETITRIFAYLRRLVDAVIADADGFNEYVAGNLPYQQRTGKIARKDFNRIEPRFRIESKDRETSIKALEDSVNGRSVPPLETMKVD